MTPHRLPREAEPTAYRVTLDPDLDAATFAGTVEIDLVLHAFVDRIVLNAAELEIQDASVAVGGSAESATVTLEPELERVVFGLAGPLPAGPATLRVSFTGVLNDKLRGFYRSTFTDDSGAAHTIATSQMEATDCRRAFPCFDEPDRKATFEITLVVGPGLGAWSNSPVASETLDMEGRRTIRFAPTMKMSSYLVAMVVGPLEETAAVDVDGVPVRIVHPPGKGHLTAYSVEVAQHALRFFSDYFAIHYPGEKLDLVAIPDFAFGAMENLGCVTFRETVLLVDPSAASRVELERIADVVSHEIAHMWFGDLVTMDWWQGIWLNEAFATFMATLCVDHFRPAWQRWVGFGLERDIALEVDGLHTTRPIEYPVVSPSDADGMFDVLTYEKGGSVLRMLEQYLGPDTFRDGVRRYLADHAHANTVTADLWDALETVSGEPVRTMMDSWILQGGHPVVAVAADALTQSPFAYLPHPLHGESAIGTHWLVPVLVREPSGGPADRLLLDGDPAPGPAPGAVVNAGGWGVYRVAYPPDYLQALAAGFVGLAPLERFNLFSDTWALILAGRAELGDLLTVAARLGHEDEPAVWSVVAGALSLCNRVADPSQRPAVQAAARALLGPRSAELGWTPAPGEGERIPSLRALLLGGLGTVGAEPSVRAEAARRFDDARSGGPAVDADIENAVLGVVADQLRPGDYDAFYDRYRHPSTPQEERRYLLSLGAFPDADLCLRSLSLAAEEVRTQDGPYLVRVLLGNRVGGPAVWEGVKARWDELLDRFPKNTHARMLESVRTLCADDALVADVTSWLEDHPLAVAPRTVDQALEYLAVNAAFARRYREGLAALLATP